MKYKKIWIPAIILVLLAAGYGIFKSKRTPQYQTAYVAAAQEVRQTVLATGTVTSDANLNLSFKNAGTVAKINVAVGDRVRTGQVLAQLDQKDANAAVSQARAALLAAKANYDKVVNGASNAEVNVAQAAVESAQVALKNAKSSYQVTKQQQDLLVANAYAALLNTGLAAVPGITNFSTATVTISGTYTGTAAGKYLITAGTSGAGFTYSISGLETYDGVITRGAVQNFGKFGLYLSFSNTGTINANDTWTVLIPNPQASGYVAANNAYLAAQQTEASALQAAQAAIDSAQAAFDSAQAQLQLKQTAARPEDVQSAQAQVDTAQAQLQAAQNTFSNTLLVAPIDGTVTSVDAKIGETVAPQKEVVVLLDQNTLHVESDISESSIVKVQPGQSIDMTFDAFGPQKHFTAKVESIDPASAVNQGVINYRVVSSLPPDQAIKPGMSANLTIIIEDRQAAVAVPNRLIKSEGGTKSVAVLRNGKIIDVPVQAGFAGDSYTEITSGLAIGDELVAPVTKK